MHEGTLQEINNTYCPGSRGCFVKAEQEVLLEPLGPKGGHRVGRFDFLLKTSAGETIGFEVLTRPSKGKLKKKLSYAKQVHKYVFVLPHNSLEFYKKKKKTLPSHVNPRFFPKEFSSSKIFVWLFDFEKSVFLEKALFSKAFNVQR